MNNNSVLRPEPLAGTPAARRRQQAANAQAPRKLLPALMLTLALAACGGSDDVPAPEASVRGQLTITNSDNSVAGCAVDADGAIATCSVRDVAELHGPGSIEVRRAQAYISNLGDHSVAVCAMADAGNVGACTLSYDAFVSPMGLASHDAHLYVTHSDDTVAACPIGGDGQLDDCNITAAGGAFSNPAGIAAGERRVFVANQGDDTVAVCSLSIDGSLLDCAKQDGGGAFATPTGVAYSASRLYVTNIGDNSVSTCTVNAGDTLVNCSKLADADNLSLPTDIAINGSTAYITNLGSHTLAVCRIGASGEVTACEAGSAGETLLYPSGIVFTPSAF